MKWLKHLRRSFWLWVDKQIVISKLEARFDKAKEEATKDLLGMLPTFPEAVELGGLSFLEDGEEIKKGYES